MRAKSSLKINNSVRNQNNAINFNCGTSSGSKVTAKINIDLEYII